MNEPIRPSVVGIAKVFLRSNAPTFAAYVLGTATISLFCPVGAAVYAAYCIAGTVAIWATVCVHCPYYGRVCPCGYSAMASSLFRRGDPGVLPRRHWLIWLFVAPSWLAPPLASVPVLLSGFSWTLFGFLVAFLFTAFVAAPALAGILGCCDYWRGCPAPKAAPASPSTQGGPA